MSELRDRRGLTEAEAIARYRAKNYPKPALTADIAIFAGTGKRCRLLLIRRGGHPFLGCWALPGGFADEGETIERTAARELEEETGISGLELRLVGVYSAPGRDPRGWTVSAAYAARGVALRAGLHCAPLAHRTGGTLPEGTLRLSLSALTGPEEIRGFLEATRRLL